MASIGPTIALGGEKAYRKQLESLNSLHRTFAAQLEKLAVEYEGNEDSLAALTKRTDLYAGMVDTQNQRVALAQSAIEAYGRKCGEAADELARANQTYGEARRTLDELTGSGKASKTALEAQRKAVVDAEKAVLRAGNAHADAERNVRQWTVTLTKAETVALKASKSLDETKQSAQGLRDVRMAEFQKRLEGVSSAAGALGDKLKSAGGEMTKYLTAPLAAGFTLLTKGTEELRGDLSKLENNANLAGVGIGLLHDEMGFLNAVTGETDSNVEALSNLLQAGYTDSNLGQIVEQLSGAVLRFPDTLKIESLADGLQETIATGKQTGQFAELLDRLGISAEQFSKGLEAAARQGKGAQYVLEELSRTDLSKATKGFEEQNQAMIEGREAAYQLQVQFARLGTKLQPVVTKITNGLVGILEAFNGLDEETQTLILRIGAVAMAAGPVVSAVGSLSSIVGLMTAKQAAHTAATLANTAALAANAGAQAANTAATAAGTAATTAAAGATASFNAALLANPAGLTAAAVAALAAAVALLLLNLKSEMPELDRFNKQLKEEKEALSDLQQARRESIGDGMAEISYTRRLWEELQTYVDASGKVIENKSRVKFLTGEINKVLPDSIKWVDSERISYEKGAEAIDRMIAKKRAQIILDAMEPEYREAVLQIRDKEIQQAELQYGVEQRMMELQKLQEEQANSYSLSRVSRIGSLQREIGQLSKSYGENEKLTRKHLAAIRDYENGMQAMSSGSIKALENLARRYGGEMSDIGQLTDAGIEKQRIAVEQARGHLEQGLITRGAFERIQREYDALVKKSEAVGMQVPAGMGKGIDRNTIAAVEAAKRSANAVLAATQETLGVHSPSRVFRDKIGRYLPAGLAEGFEAAMPEASRRMQDALLRAQDALRRQAAPASPAASGRTDAAEVYNFQAGSIVVDPKSIKDLEGFAQVVRDFKTARQQRRTR